jgi:RHS repeat-associated protein
MKTKHIAGVSIGLITIASQAGAGTVGYEKYTYDAAWNIVEKQINDQITSFDYEGNAIKSNSLGTTYLKDEAGRLQGESCSGQTEKKISYQFGDKVTRFEKDGNTTEFYYNAEGQLVGKKTTGQTEEFAWDGLGLVLRNGQTFANEEHLAGGIPAIANDEVMVSDHLGSTLSVGGEVFESTAFGEGLEDARFTGKPFVSELESFVFKCRNYSTRESCWTTSDPIGFPDGINNLAYVGGDPLSRFDPLGTTQMECERTVEVENTDSNASPKPKVRIKFVMQYTETTHPTVKPGTIEIVHGEFSWDNPQIPNLSGGSVADEQGSTDYEYWKDISCTAKARYFSTPKWFEATTTIFSEHWEK